MERVSTEQLATMPVEFKLNGCTVVGRPDETIIETAKKNGVEIPHGPQQSLGPGDRLSMALPGGGGFGLAKEREPERVARDVRLGYVSVKAALDDYGVVVDEQGKVDLPATKKARA